MLFRAEMLRAQLLELARLNKPRPTYTIGELLRSLGHEFLRLPPYHPDFNAIEMIWSQLKEMVRKKQPHLQVDLKKTSSSGATIAHLRVNKYSHWTK